MRLQASIVAFDEGKISPALKEALDNAATFYVDGNSDADLVKKMARNTAAVLARVRSDRNKTDMISELNAILKEAKEIL